MLLKRIFLIFFVIFLKFSIAESSGKIIGGSEVKDPSEFPYMCSLLLRYKVNGNERWFHFCGGTIIHYKFILTAGHCTGYARKHKIKINATLGVTDLTNGPHTWSTFIHPSDIIVHENYSSNQEFAVNDVALLRVRETMLLGRKILPIRLPSREDQNTFAGEIGTLSGWGFRDTRKPNDPNVLYFINEKILSNKECTTENKNPNLYPPTKESEICISTNYGKTACPGDSGSPLVVRNEILVGITSYVDLEKSCSAETAGPVVFMRVSHFVSWIEEKTGLKF